MSKPLALLLAGSALAATFPAAVRGQTIDYGALEQVFGEPVTTSATGKPQRATEVPLSMTIISADDIRRAAAVDIPGILREYSDLDVWQFSRGASDVSVRGYNQAYSPRLLVLVNGRQVYLDHYAMTAWNTLPVQLAEIRQIEVVKGPNTALFGFNAVGGVINIITYNPLYDDVNAATIRVGTDGYREAGAVGTAKLLGGKLGARLSASGFDADEFDTGGESFQAPYRHAPQRRALNMDTLAQLGPDTQVGVELSQSQVQQNEFIPNFAITANDYTVRSAKSTVTSATGIGLVEGTAYVNSAKISFNAPQLYPRQFTVENTVMVAKLQDLFKVGAAHSFRVAGEFRHNEMNTAPGTGSNSGGAATIAYDVYSAAGMWDWTVSPKLSVTTAARLDHLVLERSGGKDTANPYSNSDYDRTLTEPSANLGLVYKATDKDSFRASVGRGVQVPSLLELGYESRNSTGSVLGIGNPNLDPTIVTNAEIGYDRLVPEIGGKGSVTLFYQLTEDIKASPGLDFIRTAPIRVTQFQNIGDSTAIGTELGLKGSSPDGWRWGADYRLEFVSEDLSKDNGRSTLGALVSDPTYPVMFEKGTPHHLLSGRVGYTLGQWEMDLFGRYSAAYDMPYASSQASAAVYGSQHVAGYVTVDARLGYNLTENLTVAVQGTSINLSEHDETSGSAVERQLFLTVSSKF